MDSGLTDLVNYWRFDSATINESVAIAKQRTYRFKPTFNNSRNLAHDN